MGEHSDSSCSAAARDQVNTEEIGQFKETGGSERKR
jgi:hypothetical protein